MKTVEYILQDYEDMKNKRSSFDNLWQEVAERYSPAQATFKTVVNVQKMNHQKFDSSGARALPKFASIMKSIICPRTRKWAKFCTTDPDLTEYFQDYFDKVTEIINKLRYNNRSNFDSATDMMFVGAGLFGQFPFFVDDRVKEGIYYRTFPMSQVWAKENAFGEKDVFCREFECDKRQAIDMFGDKLDKDIVDSKDINKKWKFIHYVCPNDDIQDGKYDRSGMKYESFYVNVDKKQIVSVGGYHSMPYTMPRIEVFPTIEVYGYGPAMQCLPEQKVLNAAMRITMKSAELSAEPEILVREDEVVNLNLFGAAGSVIQGGIDAEGRPVAATMRRDINFNYIDKLRDELRLATADSFAISLLNLLIQDPSAKTATEVMVKKQEQAILLAPTATRAYTEWGSGVCLREFDIHLRAGRIPPIPQDLLQHLGGRTKLNIEFESPLDDAQKSEDAIKINRFFEAITPITQAYPEALTTIDPIETIKVYAKSIGVPAKVLRKNVDIRKQIEEMRQQQQAQALLEAAPTITKSMESLNKANIEAQSGVKLV